MGGLASEGVGANGRHWMSRLVDHSAESDIAGGRVFAIGLRRGEAPEAIFTSATEEAWNWGEG